MKQLGKLEADDTVEDPACFLGMHEIHINGTRILECLFYRIMRNLMEGYAVNRVFRQTKLLGQMPGDCLSFTVRVGCEIYGIAFLCELL